MAYVYRKKILYVKKEFLKILINFSWCSSINFLHGDIPHKTLLQHQTGQ